jgi:hypothetical protein
MAGQTFTLQTMERTYYKTHSADITPASVPTKSMSATTPTGVGVLDCRHANLAKFIFTGDADNNTGCAFVWGWSKMASGEWIANFIAEITFTAGARTGLISASSPFGSSHYFADIVELEYGDTATKIITDTQNNIASATVDLEGAAMVEIQFSNATSDGGTPNADCNAGIALY